MKLITVPHTGTTWLRSLLGSWGLDFETHHADVEPPSRHPWPSGGELVVCTARDPVLVEISALNRRRWVDVRLWERLAAWFGLENVHFLRIDCAGGEKTAELGRLRALLGLHGPVEVDWTPENASHDRLGLKSRYRAGDIAPELAKIWTYLTESADAEPVRRLFRSLGYDLPWLEKALEPPPPLEVA